MLRLHSGVSLTRSTPQCTQTPAVTTLDAEEDDAVDAGAPFDDAEEEDDGAGAAYGDGAEAQEGAQEDAAALGGEASPVPFDAAMALLRRRLLRGEGDVELTPSLQKNYKCGRTPARGVTPLNPASLPLSRADAARPPRARSLLMEMFGDTLKGSHNNSMLLLGALGARLAGSRQAALAARAC